MDFLRDLHASPIVDDGVIPPIAICSQFKSFDDLKEILEDIAEDQNWVLFVRKRDRTRLIIGCRRGSEDGIHCSYHLYARQHQETDVVTITSLYSEHACFATIPPQRLSVSYVKRLMVIIPELIQVTPKTTTKDIKSVLQRKEHQVSLQQC
jgi:hypothetical protein